MKESFAAWSLLITPPCVPRFLRNLRSRWIGFLPCFFTEIRKEPKRV
jgi:hypothetical protein